MCASLSTNAALQSHRFKRPDGHARPTLSRRITSLMFIALYSVLFYIAQYVILFYSIFLMFCCCNQTNFPRVGLMKVHLMSQSDGNVMMAVK